MVNVILTPGLPEAVPETPGQAPQVGAETGETGFADALVMALALSGGQEPQGLSPPLGDLLPAKGEEGKAGNPQADAQQVQALMVPAVGVQLPQPAPDPAANTHEGEESAQPVQPETDAVAVEPGQVAQSPPRVGERVVVPAADLLSELEPVEPEVVTSAPAAPKAADEASTAEATADEEASPEGNVGGVAQDTVERGDSDKASGFRPDSNAPRTLSREVRRWVDSSFDEQTQEARPEPRPRLSAEQTGPVESAAQSVRRSTHTAAEPAPPPDLGDRARPRDVPQARVEQAAAVQPVMDVRADVDADVNGRNGEAPLPSVAAAASQPATPEAARADFGVVRQTEQAPRTEQHTRVIEQIVREVHLNQSEGRRDIVVRLNPPELGTLRLQISQDVAGMTSHIQATTEQVRGLLQAHVPALIEALSNVGVRVNAVSVSSGPMFGAFAQDAQAGNAYGRQEQSRRGAANRQTTGGVEASTLFAAQQAQQYRAGYSWLA